MARFRYPSGERRALTELPLRLSLKLYRRRQSLLVLTSRPTATRNVACRSLNSGSGGVVLTTRLSRVRVLAKRTSPTPPERYGRNRLARDRKYSRTSPTIACWELWRVCSERAIPLAAARVETSVNPFRFQMEFACSVR